MNKTLIKLKAEQIEDNISGKNIPRDYGLCSKCEHFYYKRTVLMDVEVKCNDYHNEGTKILKTQPRSYDPIIECTGFWPRGQMSLVQMQNIAFIIDVKKHKIGFAGEEKTEVVVTEPKEIEGEYI